MRLVHLAAALAIITAAMLAGAAPSAAAELPPAQGPRELAAAATEQGGLEYRLAVTYDATSQGYDFLLAITNLGDQAVTFDYPTFERYDFLVSAGTEQIWHYNFNHVYVQSPYSEQLEPHNELLLKGQWDGRSSSYQPLNAKSFSVQARHLTSTHPFSLRLEEVPQYKHTDYPGASWDLVPQASDDYRQLTYLSDQGALPGYVNGYFNGDHPLYRIDIATAIARSIGDYRFRPHTESARAMLDALEKKYSDVITREMLYPPGLMPQYSAYGDVPTDHWAYGAFAWLQAQGVLEGYPEGFFNGERVLTRYEFAQAVARVLDKLDQVPADAVTLAVAEGLRGEFTDGLAEINKRSENFYPLLDQYYLEPPSEEPTQAQVTEPLHETSPSAGPQGYRDFNDVLPKHHWAYEAIRYIQRTGLLQGYPDGFFDGSRTLARSDFAQAVMRLDDSQTQYGHLADPGALALLDVLRKEFAAEIAEIEAKMAGRGPI